MTDARPLYDVSVEDSELTWEQAGGPLFERYAVTLTGRLDVRWVDCYQRITVSCPSFSRFRLHPAASSISFTCRSTDGPVEVMKLLKSLEELLSRVNREATARPVETGAKPRPTAVGPQHAKPQRDSTVAELLARFARH